MQITRPEDLEENLSEKTTNKLDPSIESSAGANPRHIAGRREALKGHRYFNFLFIAICLLLLSALLSKPSGWPFLAV